MSAEELARWRLEYRVRCVIAGWLRAMAPTLAQEEAIVRQLAGAILMKPWSEIVAEAAHAHAEPGEGDLMAQAILEACRESLAE